MSQPSFTSTPTQKKLRFRGDYNPLSFPDSRVEDFLDEVDGRNTKNGDISGAKGGGKSTGQASLYDFLKVELTRGYMLEHDEERYSARRQKIYAFMKIPREVESFIFYGVLQCADSFLYIHTFLPVRYLLAMWAIIYRPIASCFGLRRRKRRLLAPAEVCDLLKGSIWIICTLLMVSFVDTSRMYHIIKSQSIIKLYIFYNMLEVGDRLLSAFGQDAIDALFWTATEPKTSRRQHLGIIPHFCFALIYVIVHSGLIMFQATTLNVAINSSNKGLLTIMLSNNFVELKGSVFKKFDKNNLFQLTCSDVRERFHLSMLLLIVIIQTMKEFNWEVEQFLLMLPDCAYVFIAEFLIDALKHAFITRFNELPLEVYKEYTLSLAYDMTQTRQKHAFSDHSDLVARRMGFIPFPLSVVLIKAVYNALSFDSWASILLFILGYLVLVQLRVLNMIVALGKACDLMKKHQDEKNNVPSTPQVPKSRNVTDTATSPVHNYPLQRSKTIDGVPDKKASAGKIPEDSSNLGATALFSNSDVDLEGVCLNENLLNESDEVFQDDFSMTRSVPDLQKRGIGKGEDDESGEEPTGNRTHKRSESEPSIQSVLQQANSTAGGVGTNTERT
ncbi:protein TAPT1 homolog [Lutzomyia longipalpis]|uniref:protein TAPT1 homolog n=1 Tax=Lutzomyia longipalpis TaxID=7200 RepID=UPI00248414D7|nr:protein TAPT1 homolog [Lutzomyia longipalpis]